MAQSKQTVLAMALLSSLAGLSCSADAWCFEVEGHFLKRKCDRTRDACAARRANDKAELTTSAAQRGEPTYRFSACESSSVYCTTFKGATEPWCYPTMSQCLQVRSSMIKSGLKSGSCAEGFPDQP